MLDSPGRQYGIESYRTPSSLLVVLGKLALMVVYFGLLEGWWGASAGKALCGLRVARLDRTSPGLGRAAGRAMIFLGLRRIPELVLCGVCVLWKVSLDIRWFLRLLSLSSWPVTALVFSTARRRNGFAAWHDLASGTRVIQKEAYQARPVSGAEAVLESRPLLAARLG